MLLDPIAPPAPAETPRPEVLPEARPLLGAGPHGGPAHCQEPMVLGLGPDAAGEMPGGGPLEWRCRCGFRLDAGLVPLPFPGEPQLPGAELPAYDARAAA